MEWGAFLSGGGEGVYLNYEEILLGEIIILKIK
jgi:hypothetical protein